MRTVKKNITITPLAWEKARKETVKVFGFENRSGYINQLILKQDENQRRVQKHINLFNYCFGISRIINNSNIFKLLRKHIFKMKKLNTDVQIKYNKKGNIKEIKTPYDNDVTHQPFNVGEHNVAMLNGIFKNFY